MNISKYADFFHDGSIIDIHHIGNSVEFLMSSAELDKEDVNGNIILSKDDSIQGKLHVEGVNSITIDGKAFFGKLKKIRDHGKIFDFKVEKNLIELEVDWNNFPPKKKENEFSVTKIVAKKIWWETIPNLIDISPC